MNLAFCAYAHKENFQSGHNINGLDAKNVYLKNSFVALKSCKALAPADEVALVTNVKLGTYWQTLFAENGIKILFVEYDCFQFESDYGWSLAFYKLCALKHVLNMEYEKVLLLDTDVYVQRGLEDIWEDATENILLYDISRGLYNGDYRVFTQEAKDFLGTQENISRFGGEFIAGNKENLSLFVVQCEDIYEQMRLRNFKTINGDEFVTSIAAKRMREKVKNASPYVFRYWTAWRWHYVCSNYSSNPVVVLHCPREKDHGFLKLFRKMEKGKKMPTASTVYRRLHLDLFSYMKIEIVRKLLQLRN